MRIYTQFPAGWWPLLLIIYGLYALLFLLRKSHQRKREIRAQLAFASITTAISLLIEVIAVTLNVWAYFPGNWPVILWPAYFGSGLLGYQLVKSVSELLEK